MASLRPEFTPFDCHGTLIQFDEIKDIGGLSGLGGL